MKRVLVALAIAGTALALATPASADRVCAGNFTDRPLVCLDPVEVIGG